MVYRVDHLDEGAFTPIAGRPGEWMRTLATTAPIAYRRQNGGDYLIPGMQLRSGLDDPHTRGFALHVSHEDAVEAKLYLDAAE